MPSSQQGDLTTTIPLQQDAFDTTHLSNSLLLVLALLYVFYRDAKGIIEHENNSLSTFARRHGTKS